MKVHPVLSDPKKIDKIEKKPVRTKSFIRVTRENYFPNLLDRKRVILEAIDDLKII
jgi:hypothetical protein